MSRTPPLAQVEVIDLSEDSHPAAASDACTAATTESTCSRTDHEDAGLFRGVRLRDLEFGDRLGARRDGGDGFQGCNSRVFRVSLRRTTYDEVMPAPVQTKKQSSPPQQVDEQPCVAIKLFAPLAAARTCGDNRRANDSRAGERAENVSPWVLPPGGYFNARPFVLPAAVSGGAGGGSAPAEQGVIPPGEEVLQLREAEGAKRGGCDGDDDGCSSNNNSNDKGGAAVRPRQQHGNQEFALKMALTYQGQDPAQAASDMATEISVLVGRRLPPHPNIMRGIHSFQDEISKELQPLLWAGLGSEAEDMLSPLTSFLVMPLFTAGSLQALLEKRRLRCNGPPFLRLMEVMRFLQQMLSAVDHLLANGLAHNDIKPDNWLLGADHRMLVLTDFGSCVDATRPPTKPPLTPTPASPSSYSLLPPRRTPPSFDRDSATELPSSPSVPTSFLLPPPTTPTVWARSMAKPQIVGVSEEPNLQVAAAAAAAVTETQVEAETRAEARAEPKAAIEVNISDCALPRPSCLCTSSRDEVRRDDGNVSSAAVSPCKEETCAREDRCSCRGDDCSDGSGFDRAGGDRHTSSPATRYKALEEGSRGVPTPTQLADKLFPAAQVAAESPPPADRSFSQPPGEQKVVREREAYRRGSDGCGGDLDKEAAQGQDTNEQRRNCDGVDDDLSGDDEKRRDGTAWDVKRDGGGGGGGGTGGGGVAVKAAHPAGDVDLSASPCVHAATQEQLVFQFNEYFAAGTPNSIAPELARSWQKKSVFDFRRSDVYSVGVCMYYMLNPAGPTEARARNRLFGGGSSAAISARAMGPGDWFNEYGDEVWPLPLFPRDQGGYPFEVCQLCRALLQPEPQRRQSASEGHSLAKYYFSRLENAAASARRHRRNDAVSDDDDNDNDNDVGRHGFGASGVSSPATVSSAAPPGVSEGGPAAASATGVPSPSASAGLDTEPKRRVVAVNRLAEDTRCCNGSKKRRLGEYPRHTAAGGGEGGGGGGGGVCVGNLSPTGKAPVSARGTTSSEGGEVTVSLGDDKGGSSSAYSAVRGDKAARRRRSAGERGRAEEESAWGEPDELVRCDRISHMRDWFPAATPANLAAALEAHQWDVRASMDAFCNHDGNDSSMHGMMFSTKNSTGGDRQAAPVQGWKGRPGGTEATATEAAAASNAPSFGIVNFVRELQGRCKKRTASSLSPTFSPSAAAAATATSTAALSTPTAPRRVNIWPVFTAGPGAGAPSVVGPPMFSTGILTPNLGTRFGGQGGGGAGRIWQHRFAFNDERGQRGRSVGLGRGTFGGVGRRLGWKDRDAPYPGQSKGSRGRAGGRRGNDSGGTAGGGGGGGGGDGGGGLVGNGIDVNVYRVGGSSARVSEVVGNAASVDGMDRKRIGKVGNTGDGSEEADAGGGCDDPMEVDV